MTTRAAAKSFLFKRSWASVREVCHECPMAVTSASVILCSINVKKVHICNVYRNEIKTHNDYPYKCFTHKIICFLWESTRPARKCPQLLTILWAPVSSAIEHTLSASILRYWTYSERQYPQLLNILWAPVSSAIEHTLSASILSYWTYSERQYSQLLNTLWAPVSSAIEHTLSASILSYWTYSERQYPQLLNILWAPVSSAIEHILSASILSY